MAKPTIKKSSPAGTPEEDVIYVIEYPATSRIKVRKVDLEREIAQLSEEIKNKSDRKTEVEILLVDINKIK